MRIAEWGGAMTMKPKGSESKADFDAVLLIEDNPDDRVLTERALKKCGAARTVVGVCDGAEALDYLFGLGAFAGRDMRARPELILLDLNIPKIDGLGVLEGIRTDPRTRHIPVIILTASDREADLAESCYLGADCFLRKTADFEGFCETVKEMIPQWVRLRRKGGREIGRYDRGRPESA
jgi:two-component system, response regulator